MSLARGQTLPFSVQTMGAHYDCCVLPKYCDKLVCLLDNVGRSDLISRAGLASQSNPANSKKWTS